MSREVHRERTQPGQVTPADLRDPAPWGHAQQHKKLERKEEEGDIWSDDVCLSQPSPAGHG